METYIGGEGCVLLYLPTEDKKRFEDDVIRFISNVRITGVQTEVDITDKLLVASSAVIPVFGFPEWDYTFLDEVLLYPGSFDSKYNIHSKEEIITGMVGSGTMEGKSDINEYGATHQHEFLAVVGEYFFKRRQMLKKNHPEIYSLLAKAFQQDTANVLKVIDQRHPELQRNDPCPCGSDKKFKKCCMNKVAENMT